MSGITTRSYKKGKTISSKKETSVLCTICNKLGEDMGGDHLGQQQGKVTQEKVRKKWMYGRNMVSIGSEAEPLAGRGNKCSTAMGDGHVISCDDDGKRYGFDYVFYFNVIFKFYSILFLTNYDNMYYIHLKKFWNLYGVL